MYFSKQNCSFRKFDAESLKVNVSTAVFFILSRGDANGKRHKCSFLDCVQKFHSMRGNKSQEILYFKQ
jgi:hypothetical protein